MRHQDSLPLLTSAPSALAAFAATGSTRVDADSARNLVLRGIGDPAPIPTGSSPTIESAR